MEGFDSYLNAELLATCNSLGTYDKDSYEKDADCLESVKDLIKYLRKDNEAHEIRRQLGTIKVLQTDILQILKYYSEDEELFDVVLRLLVNLTNPAVLLYREELPEEKTARKHYLEIVSHLQSYKQGFTSSKVWAVLSTKLGKLLQLNRSDRQEEDRLAIERILILVRNVLHVPVDLSSEKRAENDVSVHDQVLWALHMSGMEDLLLYLSAAREEEEQYCFHVLEIISLMFREQDPQQLASAATGHSVNERNKDEKELKELKQREAAQKKKAMQNVSPRYPRFGGNFYVKNVKSVSDRELICHRLITDLQSICFDKTKMVKRKPRNRQPMQDTKITRRSTLSIRLFLKNFCEEFLNLSYNCLMALVKENLVRQHSQDHDETYYLWAMQFFMEFNRLNKQSLAFVSETISIQSFHYIQTQLDSYYEMIVADKKKIKHWSKRMHLALKAYKEMLMTLASMDVSEEENIRNCARVIKGNVFYLAEYRDLLLTLLMNYDEIKFSKTYLKDLVETTHIFLKMMENQCSQHSHLVVQEKKHKASRKKVKKSKPQYDEEKQEREWDSIADVLSAALQSTNELPQVPPFDAASDKSIEEQKEDAMLKIKDLLCIRKTDEALSAFRAAREVWPDDIFGSLNMESEEEFIALREIFFQKVSQVADSEQMQYDEEDEEDEEEAANATFVSERELNFLDFVKRFATTKVVQAYTPLLATYRDNSSHTNHCIAKMLHRISWDCKMYGLLYQARVFRIFQNILDDFAKHMFTSVKELSKLALFIIKKFFETAERNKKAFMELLFWKNSQEVYEVQEGYGTFEKSRSAKILWTEEQEEELRHLFNEYKDVRDKDPVDLIMEHLTDNTKTRRQVIRQLKAMDLVGNLKELKPKKSVRLPSAWQEDEEVELRQLFEKYKGTTNVLGFILNNLTVKRPKHRVIEKLLELGMVADRKELRKKRAKKSDPNKKQQHDKDGESDSFSDEGGKSSEELDGSGNDRIDSSESESDEYQETELSSMDKMHEGNTSLNTTDLKELLSQMMSLGMESVLNWLQESLEEAAEDRLENPEAIPLVPLLEAHHQAMEMKDFTELLKAVGLSPPSDEQETFWRIPVKLTTKMLQVRSLVLKKALEGDFSELDNLQDQELVNKKKKRVHALKLLVEKNKDNSSINNKSDLLQSSENIPTDSSPQQSKAKRIKKERNKEVKNKGNKEVKNKGRKKGEDNVPQKSSDIIKHKKLKIFQSSDDSDDEPLMHLKKQDKSEVINELISDEMNENIPERDVGNIQPKMNITIKSLKKKSRLTLLSDESDANTIDGDKRDGIQAEVVGHTTEKSSNKMKIHGKRSTMFHLDSSDDEEPIVNLKKEDKLELISDKSGENLLKIDVESSLPKPVDISVKTQMISRLSLISDDSEDNISDGDKQGGIQTAEVKGQENRDIMKIRKKRSKMVYSDSSDDDDEPVVHLKKQNEPETINGVIFNDTNENISEKEENSLSKAIDVAVKAQKRSRTSLWSDDSEDGVSYCNEKEGILAEVKGKESGKSSGNIKTHKKRLRIVQSSDDSDDDVKKQNESKVINELIFDNTNDNVPEKEVESFVSKTDTPLRGQDKTSWSSLLSNESDLKDCDKREEIQTEGEKEPNCSDITKVGKKRARILSSDGSENDNETPMHVDKQEVHEMVEECISDNTNENIGKTG